MWPRIFGNPARSLGNPGGGASITYLFRYLFGTDAAAPMTSPLTDETGTLSFTDVASGRWQKSGGTLSLTGSASTGSGPEVDTAVTRATGLAFTHRTKADSASSANSISPGFGFSTTATGTPNNGSLWWTNLGSFVVIEAGSALGITSLDACLDDTYYKFYHVLRGTGAFTIIDDGSNAKMHFIHAHSNAATMYAQVRQQAANRRTPVIDYMAGAQLAGAWSASDYGIATDRLAGARSASDTFAHEANALWIDFTLTTLPSAGSVIILIRRTDDNNCWKLEVTSAGAFNLIEIVAGVANTRATIAGNTSGDRLMCGMDGSKALLYRGRAHSYTLSSLYSSVSTFTTQTAGVINSLGTGGAVSDLIAWPRNITGSALSELRRMD